ncbi:MAG: hypothetical protein GTO63_33795 [Anaerolineae bacterium]|nr:hypothetical protein [Anaerolineae bacterium]NIN99609.1 hypothetical protein [Anaerolineae bacterium]NIQ82469.1 hypothetical protein [Anaerolineae bacterium]
MKIHTPDPGMMNVEAHQDGMGNIHVMPKTTYWRKRFQKAVAETNFVYQAGLATDASVFFQEGGPASEFIENHVPEQLRHDLEHGWNVYFQVDPWEYAHWLGWDVPERF